MPARDDNAPKGGAEPELTARALAIGCAIGAVLATANVYMGLKTGWNDSGNVTAAILGFALLSVVHRVGGRAPSTLETNIVQSAATAAAGMAFTSGLCASFPALSMMGHHYPAWALVVWSLAASLLGIAVAARLRRRLFAQTLPFPTGLVTAELIRTVHRVAGAGRDRARLLLAGFAGAGTLTWFRDGYPRWIPQATMLPGRLGGVSLASLTLGVSWSPVLFGAGLLIGPHLGTSLMIGGVIAFGLLAPWLTRAHVVAAADYPSLVSWLLWPAVAMMVAATLTTIVADRRTLLRAASAVRADARGTSSDGEARAFWPACAAATAGLTFIGWRVFGVSPLIVVPTVVGAIVLAAVALRAVGETDVNPVGPIGQVTQFAVGGVAPAHPVGNLVAGAVSVGAVAQAGASIWALNAGHRLQGNVRRQLIAQLFGAATGTLVVVPVYTLLVRAYALGGPRLPAPGALPWKTVAEALAHGAAAMPRFGLTATAVGAFVGVLLAVLGHLRAHNLVPSAMALGIGMMVPFTYSFTIFAGGLALGIIARRRPSWTETHVPSVAAGFIAGESLIGVLAAALLLVGVLVP